MYHAAPSWLYFQGARSKGGGGGGGGGGHQYSGIQLTNLSGIIK